MVRRQGVLQSCSGQRDVRDIEILGISLSRTEEGLEYEARQNIARHCWKGCGRVRNRRR